MGKIREEIYKKLTAPFPDVAYAADMTRAEKVLTSLKAQYIVERLNEVFGLGNWKLDGEWNDVEDGVLFFGKLECYFMEDGNQVTIATGTVPGFAGVDHASTGDAYKSARTDSLSKSASLLGVGNEMYKGNIEPKLSEDQKAKLEARNQRKEAKQDVVEDEKETQEAAPKSEKPRLTPARGFNRASRFKSRNERENNGSAESTDNAN